MSIILYAILPIFLIMGIGFCVERFQMLPISAATGLNAYSIRVAWPVMTVYLISNANPENLFQGRLWLGFLGAHGLMYVLGYLVDRKFLRRGAGSAVITAVSVSSSMAAFVSLPIIFNLLPGNKETLTLAGLLALTPTFTLAAALVHLDIQKRRENNLTVNIGSLARLVLLNPLIVAVFVGVILCLLELRLWAPLDKAAALVSATSAPCALIAIGMSFRTQLLLMIQHLNSQTIKYQVSIMVAKMLILPLFTWAFLAVLGIGGPTLLAGIILSCSGVAAGSYVIADSYKYEIENTAVALVLSNLLSVLSLAGFAYLCIEVLHMA